MKLQSKKKLREPGEKVCVTSLFIYLGILYDTIDFMIHRFKIQDIKIDTDTGVPGCTHAV